MKDLLAIVPQKFDGPSKNRIMKTLVGWTYLDGHLHGAYDPNHWREIPYDTIRNREHEQYVLLSGDYYGSESALEAISSESKRLMDLVRHDREMNPESNTVYLYSSDEPLHTSDIYAYIGEVKQIMHHESLYAIEDKLNLPRGELGKLHDSVEFIYDREEDLIRTED